MHIRLDPEDLCATFCYLKGTNIKINSENNICSQNVLFSANADTARSSNHGGRDG